jgi:hypothetical protein
MIQMIDDALKGLKEDVRLREEMEMRGRLTNL